VKGRATTGKRIVLTGLAQNPRLGGSADRGTYTSFVLADGTARVPGIAPGTQDVSQGDVVEVRGFLWPRRRALGIPGAPVGPPG
jgi:hypothetical protein